MSDTPEILSRALKVLKRETFELLHSNPYSQLEYEKSKLTPLVFMREFVSKNRPVVIRGGCSHFPATKKWTPDYFYATIPDKEVTVAITPNGYADALTFRKESNEEYFVMPEEKSMLMRSFLDTLEHPKENFVCYIQRQNSNMGDFPELANDIPSDVNWATEAFGEKPDAVNFWMGDSRAVTSLHKDPYENIYCVIDGRKDFILIPPTDLPYVHYGYFKTGIYKDITTENYTIEPVMHEGEYQMTPWISNFDPLRQNALSNVSNVISNEEISNNINIYNISLEKGDILYLPSLWFHHVRQSHGCISVNYWYDMVYDIKYCYNEMLKALCL